MNTAELKLLHGIYHHREMVGEAIPYSAGELNWLIHASFREGRRWMGSGNRLNTREEPDSDWLARHALTKAHSERPLRYLKAKGLIDYTKELGGFRVSITAPGADLARELSTFYGRMNYRYRTNKDGLLWLTITVLASIVTTLLTQSCKTQPQKEAPQVIVLGDFSKPERKGGDAVRR